MRGKHTAPPASRDWAAADLIKRLREDRGLSRQQLAHQVARVATKNPAHPYTVSARTVYRIEEEGAEPTVRVKFALASFFEVPVSEVWQGSRRSRATA